MHSGSNEGKTDGDLASQGLALSQEISQFVSEHAYSDIINRISFVGYSLGGLIIRAALPNLHSLRSKFYAFVTLGSPHLGYLYKKGTLFNTGMWIFNKVGESQVLTQLRYDDGDTIKDCFMYRLAMQEGLESF
jgi:hypothetical protein